MKYEKQLWQLAFYLTWNHLTHDKILHSFYDNSKKAFVDDFTTVSRIEEEGYFYRADDEGDHLNVIFHTIYEMIAKNLHPDPPGISLTNKERHTIFSGLEFRPTKIEDLIQSILKEEVGYKKNMKSMVRSDRLYGYLYFHLYKGIIEHILDVEKGPHELLSDETSLSPTEKTIELINEETKVNPLDQTKIGSDKGAFVDLLYGRIRNAKLSIRQSCLTLYFLNVPIISLKDAVSACGYSPNSVKDFRDFYTSIRINETIISDHGRDTKKNLSRVLDFLIACEYDVSQANYYYSIFKGRVQS